MIASKQILEKKLEKSLWRNCREQWRTFGNYLSSDNFDWNGCRRLNIDDTDDGGYASNKS